MTTQISDETMNEIAKDNHVIMTIEEMNEHAFQETLDPIYLVKNQDTDTLKWVKAFNYAFKNRVFDINWDEKNPESLNEADLFPWFASMMVTTRDQTMNRLKTGSFKRESINGLVNLVHSNNVKAGWWTDLTFKKKVADLEKAGFTYDQIFEICKITELSEKKQRNVGELLALCHSELSEGLEGQRKNLMDDKLPHRSMLEVELADCVIRIFDMCGGLGLDLGGAIEEKLDYNKTREDHKIENRMGVNGKKI